jgi:hypothetical protein
VKTNNKKEAQMKKFLCALLILGSVVICFGQSAQASCCKQLAGAWNFTYDNSTDNQTDKYTTNGSHAVTLTVLTDNESAAFGGPGVQCLAYGKRPSDNASIFIKSSAYYPEYRYYEASVGTTIPSGTPYARIGDNATGYTGCTINTTPIPSPSQGVVYNRYGFMHAAKSPCDNGTLSCESTTTTISPLDAHCKDWLGSWMFKYDSGDEEINIASACKRGESCIPTENAYIYECLAKGKRVSDNVSITIMAIMFVPNDYIYYESADPGQSDNNSRIPVGTFDNCSFVASTTDNYFHLNSGKNKNAACSDDNGTDDNATCELNIVPKRIFKVLAFAQPFSPYVIIAPRNSGIEFDRPISIDWGTEAINDITHIKLGKRLIFGVGFARPFKLERGEFTFTVTYGDNDTQQCGTVEVK